MIKTLKHFSETIIFCIGIALVSCTILYTMYFASKKVFEKEPKKETYVEYWLRSDIS